MVFFKKDRKVLGMSFLARMMVVVLVVGIVGVSGTVVMAGWVDDSGENSGQVIYIDINNIRVGIGTLDPKTTLHVYSASGDSRVISQVIVPTNYSTFELFSGTAQRAKIAGTQDTLGGQTGNMIFYTRPSTGSLTEKMRITSNGNVGIGTTNPGTKLHVSQGDIMIDNCYGIGAGGNSQGIYDNSQNAYIRFDVGGAERLRITKEGNVGIGISTPGNNKLSVAGTISASSYACISDSRYKKNITLYQNALEKVLGLRGVTFFWNAEKYKDRNFSKEKQIGFIAQEVEKVIPEIVYTDDKGYKTMSYDRLTAVLVEAVKELKAEKDGEIASLKSENEKLKADNAELKEKLAGLDSLEKRLAALEKSDMQKEARIAKK